MFRTLMTSVAVIVALGGAATAETFEVKMLNKGEAGRMIFESAALRIAAGDTVKFVASNEGHNAEAVVGMKPKADEASAGKINEKIEVILTKTKFYGVKRKPHWGMGMVIAVGNDVDDVDRVLESKMPRKAKALFEESISDLRRQREG